MRRRELLRLLSVLGPARWLVGCGDNLPDPATLNAAAMLEPTPSAFFVVVWSLEARTATVEVITLGVRTTYALGLNETGSAVLDVSGLPADVEHLVTITTDQGIVLGPHRVRTAPTDDATRPVVLAVSADLDPNPIFDSELIPNVLLHAPELYVSIGDSPYTDNGPPAMTVETYRERHAQLRTAPKVRLLHEACGVRAIYDDHEFRNNWDAMRAASEPERYAAAMQVWDEFFPVRGAIGEVRYRTWRWGAHVECFLLDCRRFRSADAAPNDATKTMLGATQLAWFLAGVTASTATFKLVFTSIPLDFGDGNDDWSSFTFERQAIFDALLAAGTPGVLFISGDQHWFASHQHAYGIREFQIGPVARGCGTPPAPVAGVLYRSVQFNIGLIEVAGDQLTFSGIGQNGEAFHREVLTAEALRPRSITIER